MTSTSTRRRRHQVTALLEQLGARQLEPHRQLRGQDFFPTRRFLDQLPSMVAAGLTPASRRTLWLHYYTTDVDLYVAGFNPAHGWAFGYCIDRDIPVEGWGEFNLNAYCSLLIPTTPPVLTRRDLSWTPQPASSLLSPAQLAS